MATIPSGFKAALSKYPSPFDKEALLDDDKELWLIRIPDNLDEEDLANMKIKLPTNKATKKALGKLEKDSDNKYALYKVPTEQEDQDAMDEAEENEDSIDLGISGHEMVAFDCLVPSREENGKLAFAPKKFDQLLILNQVVDIPDSTALAQSILDKPVYKRDQPEGLTMRFKPYGYYSGQVKKDNADTTMEDTTTTEEKKRKRVNVEEDDDEEEKKKAKKDKKEKKEKKDKKKDKKEKK